VLARVKYLAFLRRLQLRNVCFRKIVGWQHRNCLSVRTNRALSGPLQVPISHSYTVVIPLKTTQPCRKRRKGWRNEISGWNNIRTRLALSQIHSLTLRISICFESPTRRADLPNDGGKLSHMLSRESSQPTATEVEQQPTAPKTEPASLREVRSSEKEQGNSLGMGLAWYMMAKP
jgi:hypothetical protein